MVGVIVVLGLLSIAFLLNRYGFQLYRYITGGPEIEKGTEQQNQQTPTPTSTPPGRTTGTAAEAQAIKADLERRSFCLRGDFATGSEVKGDVKITQFLDALAEALEGKDYRVAIFIYGKTDEPGDKKGITNKRAEQISAYLGEKHKGVMEKLEVVKGGGMPYTDNLPRDTPQDIKVQMSTLGKRGASIIVKRTR